MDEREKQHKLKALERTLAEELDQAGAPAASGTAPSAPTPAPAPAGVQPASVPAAADAPPISIDEFDALLRDNDPDFEKQLKDLGDGIRESTAGLSIERLNIDELIEDEEDDPLPSQKDVAPPAAAKQSEFLKKVILLAKGIAWAPVAVIRYVRSRGIREAIQSLREELPKIGERVMAELLSVRDEGRLAWKNFKAASRKQKSNLLLLAGALVLLVYFGTRLIGGGGLPLPQLKDYMSSLEPVAEKVTKYDVTQPMEDFNSPLRHPEHVVLLRKIVVNLRPSEGSTRNPMAAFELLIEAASRDTAIEVKDREKEMIDISARVAESFEFGEFSEGEGKERFKLALRRELNKVLTTGRVRKVYFKTVFHKR
ncbi:MAG TPA: flagellar basal body-associated FliL family protein [Bdellovibrionales bacterium]|nr:flagellar basal body-associated FliL family protein [Bdellovibrionales bacterium]